MGKLKGRRQATFYVEPELYEVARCTAYTLGENIYQFVDEALRSAVSRRLTKAQKTTIEEMARNNIKRGGTRRRAIS